jgi:hypothetical protein
LGNGGVRPGNVTKGPVKRSSAAPDFSSGVRPSRCAQIFQGDNHRYTLTAQIYSNRLPVEIASMTEKEEKEEKITRFEGAMKVALNRELLPKESLAITRCVQGGIPIEEEFEEIMRRFCFTPRLTLIRGKGLIGERLIDCAPEHFHCPCEISYSID